MFSLSLGAFHIVFPATKQSVVIYCCRQWIGEFTHKNARTIATFREFRDMRIYTSHWSNQFVIKYDLVLPDNLVIINMIFDNLCRLKIEWKDGKILKYTIFNDKLPGIEIPLITEYKIDEYCKRLMSNSEWLEQFVKILNCAK